MTDEAKTAASTASEATPTPTYSIEKIYVKDLSLEIPNAPQVFLEQEAPQIDVQIHHTSTNVNPGVYQTSLTVTITAKLGEKTMFLVEVTQAGIFTINNIPNQDLEPILAITNPNILYPYAREVVSDTIVRAGFPPILLNPINFEALYQQQKVQEQANNSASSPALQ